MGTVTISMLFLIRLRILQNDFPKSALFWGFCYIYLRLMICSDTAPLLYMCLYWYVCAYYNGVCIDMFVNLIMVYLLLRLCILYYLIVRYTSYWYFVLYLSCEWIIPPLYHSYIWVFINMFMNIIFLFTAIFLLTS